MKNSYMYWAVATMALLSTRPALAQEDPTVTMPLKPAKVAGAPVRALRPEAAARLKTVQADLTKKKLEFEVGYSSAMDKQPKQLCGSKAPKSINAAAIAKQEKLNGAMQAQIQTELKADNITIPTGPVAAGGLPANWWGGAWLSPVKNQGNCGSCWAFAAAAAFEHAHRKFYGGPIADLSEQNMVDCGRTSTGLDAGSCEEGGWSDRAFDYLRTYGTANESAQPYVAVDQTCTKVRKKHYAYNWGQLYPDRFPNRDEVKRMVRKYGSVVTYMKAGVGSFYAYKSGVYNDYANTEENDVDHAVTIVGWSDKYNAWIIKNSWGTDWGYNGYAYVHYDHCNVGNYVYYVMPRHSYGRVSTAPMAATPNGEEKPLVSDKSPIMEAAH